MEAGEGAVAGAPAVSPNGNGAVYLLIDSGDGEFLRIAPRP
jgi:hypothetical protein